MEEMSLRRHQITWILLGINLLVNLLNLFI